ncbi:MAG TPA: anti-sigma factor domain-containing protein [Acetivibrio clariflavus]|nr:anti-sigma factor domain-containing protein [Acetivibrio clariflavus]
MDSGIHYTTENQKENQQVKNDLFVCLEKGNDNNCEEVYAEVQNEDDFDRKKTLEDVLDLKKKLKRYKISFRNLLTCAPKNDDTIYMCIKTAKGIAENERIMEEIEKKKKLPIQEILKTINVYHGTVEKNGTYIIALCLIMTSGLESLNLYINETYTKKEPNRNVGTVLEIAPDGVIVMTGNCNFLLLRKRKGMFLGQQIKFANWEVKRYNRNIAGKIFAGVAVSCAAVLMLAFNRNLIYYPSDDRVYAFVDIDINPSLGLSIDKNNLVVDVNTINRDADVLLMDNDLRGIPVKDAIEMIFEFAHDRGFVYEDRENLVLISLGLNPDVDEEGDQAEKFVQLFNQIELEIKGDEVIVPLVIAAPQDTVKSAKRNNLSIGRQYIYENSHKFDLGEIRRDSIEDLIFESEIFAEGS